MVSKTMRQGFKSSSLRKQLNYKMEKGKVVKFRWGKNYVTGIIEDIKSDSESYLVDLEVSDYHIYATEKQVAIIKRAYEIEVGDVVDDKRVSWVNVVDNYVFIKFEEGGHLRLFYNQAI